MTRPTRPHTGSAQRGFTLVELVTAVVIIGIVGAVAAPRFVDTTVFSTRGFADELAASLRYSQRIAIASSCNVRVTVNAAGYSAAQPSAFCNTASGWATAVAMPDRTPLASPAPTGVAVSAAVIEFNSTGALVNPAGPVNVGAYVVTINAATGAVTVQ